ncbi:MAG: metal-binding protein [Hoeflea sp.]|uniref:DUF411 domain-containing protein n=1 Tax=Hoeflea sp. TaxID=1940281 RepID=UPI001D62431F|nr:DUF411 domain-containing protein [Hoeflea sp.]MBU4529322.1 metal-binding protein [Alphaproteobacteria bacterium]MBU4545489.1 metal-binding protein [Alphaproteobacteria bacterium]MBU4550204.1 metal-binding protein [Alphaproteobacteria bacterium]MBV1723245.1 metal-binding protein [Hoeflea sp.]MBV1782918.1 metal-binding protein [Hoeflea sp.]
MKKISFVPSVAALALVGGTAFITLTAAQTAQESATAVDAKAITIWLDPSCGCCDVYADYMEANGFTVTRVDDRDFDKRSIEMGVPEKGIGCHLAEIDGYVVSGLVPVEIIERLVSDRPDVTGITLPGMPGNAPGMAPVKTGTLKTYAFGTNGVTVYSDE